MAIYRFTTNITVDTPDKKSRAFRDGDTVGADELLAGCLATCLRRGYLVEHTEPEPDQSIPQANEAGPESGSAAETQSTDAAAERGKKKRK